MSTRSIVRGVITFILVVVFFFLSGCATLRPMYAVTTGDSFVLPHSLQQTKALLREQIHQERRAGYHVELAITVHCYQNTEQWYCTWMCGFLMRQFDRLAPVRLYWDDLLVEAPAQDRQYVFWDVNVISSD